MRKEKTYKKQRRLNSCSCSDTSSRLNSECDDFNDKKILENDEAKIDSNNKIDIICQNDGEFNFDNDYFDSFIKNDLIDNDLDNKYLIDFDTSTDEDDKKDSPEADKKFKKKNYKSLSRLSLSNGSIERYNYKTKQPHIIFYDCEGTNREVNLILI